MGKKLYTREKEFISKPENGLVIATMDRNACECIADEVHVKCSRDVYHIINSMIIYDYELPYELDICRGEPYKAVVRCKEDDVFNENVGKEIAASVCDKKYHQTMAKKYKMILKLLKKAIVEIEKLQFAHEAKVMNIDYDIQRCYMERKIE